MFSIAAINDADSKDQWEPLAPTKEAQEFHLHQTYHDGLLRLQDKEYDKARELLESVLKDPLISNAQVDNNVSDDHLLQLRFLTLKNLASVFLQQGSTHYESALSCFLQAVEIDSNDSVVWNQLGTLSCTMNLLSISRWAFEQGLYCSPKNWNCMEKLLEVLIAIGDEVGCLSITELILRHWPSHSRALHVKSTIQESDTVPFAPHGIDKLEPKHIRLKFPNKRKATDDIMNHNITPKRLNRNMELHLGEASLSALIDAIINVNKTSYADGIGSSTLEQDYNVRISIQLPSSSEIVLGSVENKTSTNQISQNMKEKETSISEEHPQERRSTRLERLRSRKPGKEELDFASGKDPAKVVLQFLEPFMDDRLIPKDPVCTSGSFSFSGPGIVKNLMDQEETYVTGFIARSSNNYGALHMAHLILEEVACQSLSYQESFVKLLELEKLTRRWVQDRTAECSLFLAELYYDFGSCSANESKRSLFFCEASYHLCKVIESVALDLPSDLNDKFNINGDAKFTRELTDPIPPIDSVDKNFIIICKTHFWVRFFWLSGRLSVSSGDKEKAYKEFCISLFHLSNAGDESKDYLEFVPVRHCKLVRGLTIERVQHEINLLKVDSFLRKITREMIEKGRHPESVTLLGPLLLSTKDVYLDLLSCAYKEGEGITSVELLALDVLILACEMENPMNIEVYLNSHRRKLQLLTSAAGMVDSPASQKVTNKSSGQKLRCASEFELVESIGKHWNNMVAEEVKAISQSASRVKTIIDQSGFPEGFSAHVNTIGEIQSLLLTVMCNIVGVFLCQKSSASAMTNQTEELESRSFVDAAIAFCKLQHLNPCISVKTQVELIVAVHELLAEYGLCCAGKDSEGEEGAFLKLAIRHLFALDIRLKSNLHTTNKVPEAKQCDLNVSHSNAVLSVGMSTLGKGEKRSPVKDALEEMIPEVIGSNELLNEKGVDSGKEDPDEKLLAHGGEQDSSEAVECGIDIALDQSFFCLYGLNLRSGSDLACEDDLSIHKNTSRGDYQTKEQCADVFQYILPYAKASSRSGLVKLRRVLRAIHKHFPQPPEEMLKENPIDTFLDNPHLCEDKLSAVAVGSNVDLELIISTVFPNGKGLDACKASTGSCEPFLEIYKNLYYYLAQAEEMSATDKWPGFVLTKEGEDFVEQSRSFFKYDLLYNPLRFESWQQLAHIYDEEVDLLLNDGSKHINVVEWRKHPTLPQRVDISRRRARRCSLMSVALAKTPAEQSLMHELLALVYYDSLQNVVPIYDQRSFVPVKNTGWMKLCQNSMRHFEKAFHYKPDWSHAFYLGKLCEKTGVPSDEAFSYYKKAVILNPSAVDPVYRIHASRLKLLNMGGKEDLNTLEVVTAYSFSQSTKDTVLKIIGCTTEDLQFPKGVKDGCVEALSEKGRNRPELHQLEEAWNTLYNDCLSAIETCVEGELKHFHKARYMLAKGLCKRGKSGDLEKAKEELSFCFRSSRSPFTINMWEIDGMVRKGRRKTPGVGGNKKTLEISLSESSRKFITCIRKYILLYLSLLEKSGDFCTLDRAYGSLRADKRFSLCLEDIAPVALGRYIEALSSSIRHSKPGGSSRDQMLDRMFNLFMEHVNLWSDLSALPEFRTQDFSESTLYRYIHEYIQSLEKKARLDTLEVINEKIRKRFKNPKLSNANFAGICKHASVAWCRSILVSLALITPLNVESPSPQVPAAMTGGSEYGGTLLHIDLHMNDLWSLSSFEDSTHLEGLQTKWAPILSRIKNAHIKQVLEKDMEAANSLLRSAYSFYRESPCGTLPSGINLYTVPYRLSAEGPFPPPVADGVEILDLTIPRKLLIWAYTLVFGRYSNILAVVKHCEETVKSKVKRGVAASSASHTSISICTHTGGSGKERATQCESGALESPSATVASASLQGDCSGGSHRESGASETHKALSAPPPLLQCNNSINTERHLQNVDKGDNNAT